jgi:folate-binding protein YgfZ
MRKFMRAALLSERSAVRVTGADAPRYLNGLVTHSVETLSPGEARFAALLTPQGKIVVDFFAVAVEPEDGGGFALDCPRALGEELVKRLLFYRLRSKVEIEARPDLAIAAVLDQEPPADLGLVYADPRHAGLGWRAVLPAEDAEAALAAAGAALVDPELWQKLRIALGVPEGGKDFAYGDTFPHEADMDALNGVDFHKGCFIGQEVVSRVERRGTARARVVPVAYEHAAPEAGIEVHAGERAVGHMGSAAGGRGLALLRLDRVAEALAAGETLAAGGVSLSLVKPGWAKFPFPGETEAAS